jgi:hypothetical protein
MNDNEMKHKVEKMALERYGKAFTFVLVIAIVVLLVIYGFSAFVFIVMMGKLLRQVIMRPENYYQDEEDDRDDA